MKVILFLKKYIGYLISFLSGVGITLVIQLGNNNINGNYNSIKQDTSHTRNIDTALAIENKTILPWQYDTIWTDDGRGHQLVFILAILTQEKIWEFGNDTFLSGHISILDSLPRFIYSLPALQDFKEIIAIGVASVEGSVENEYTTADNRADRIVEVIRFIPGKKPYKLNLGKYIGKNNLPATSWQRRVIIAGIISKDNSMSFEDIKFAIHKGLKKHMKNKIGIELSDYNDFNFTEPS